MLAPKRFLLKRRVIMDCPRCNGLMIVQAFAHLSSESETWKCVNCGNIIAKKEKVIEIDNITMFYHQQKTNKR